MSHVVVYVLILILCCCCFLILILCCRYILILILCNRRITLNYDRLHAKVAQPEIRITVQRFQDNRGCILRHRWASHTAFKQNQWCSCSRFCDVVVVLIGLNHKELKRMIGQKQVGWWRLFFIFTRSFHPPIVTAAASIPNSFTSIRVF